MHLSFEYPIAFLLLAALFCFVRCKREHYKIYFAKSSFLPRTFLARDYLPLLIAATFVLAIASPFSYASFAKSTKKGRDLVIAIDASGSMGGEFGDKSKFATLIDLARSFIKRRYDDNIGVVVFGTFAYTAAPITYDTKALDFLFKVGQDGQCFLRELPRVGLGFVLGQTLDRGVNTTRQKTCETQK